MRWCKRGIRKAGNAIAGLLLLLVLMIWVPVSAGAYEGASDLATPVTGTVQATSMEDATVTALNKEKLAQEVQQLKNQNEPDLLGWLQTNASILLSTFVVVIGGLIGLWRWLADRQDTRLKQAEERFQKIIEGLYSDKDQTRVGAASMLRTFLQPGYKQFHRQVFDLVVAHLQVQPLGAEPPSALSQALTIAFKDSVPLVSKSLKHHRGYNPGYEYESLDARGIHLDSANLYRAELGPVWMSDASLQKASLAKAFLSGVVLEDAHLEGADLKEANLENAVLTGIYLTNANLTNANLKGAKLSGAHLLAATLTGANLTNANLGGGEDLSYNHYGGADFSGTILEDALFLDGTDLRGVKGLTKEQKETCKARGAIIDEDTTTSSSQPIVPTLPPSQSNDAQAPSAPPAQESTLPPDTGGSGATPSSKPSPAS